jgi:hypothetical protein
MKYSRALGIAVGACVLAASSAWADVQVTMQNGLVSIVAKDATLRQIMTEWARVGQTTIVNVERIPGGPMTLELTNVPEEKALSVLMRPLSGYLAAPRADSAPNTSRYDRILVMPTVAAAPQPVTATTASPPPPPVFQTGQPAVQAAQPQVDEDVDERQGAVPGAPARAPVFTTFPQPQVVNPGAVMPQNGVPPAYVVPPGMQMPVAPAAPQQPPPGPVPTIPQGSSVPGMMVPTPTQPGVQAPGTPVRRPGGI